jgi:hypothetical protein
MWVPSLSRSFAAPTQKRKKEENEMQTHRIPGRIKDNKKLPVNPQGDINKPRHK